MLVAKWFYMKPTPLCLLTIRPQAHSGITRRAPTQHILDAVRRIAYRQSPERAGDSKTMKYPTPELLVTGGDARIAIDPATGANKYNCSPQPAPALLAYGSSTASTISAEAFAAVEEYCDYIGKDQNSANPAATYKRELQNIRNEFLDLYGFKPAQAPEIIFAASGTDLHLITSQLAAAGSPLAIIGLEAAETGNGVPNALAGKHFSSSAPSGDKLIIGKQLENSLTIEVMQIAARDDSGNLRGNKEIDRELQQMAENAIAKNMRVLIILTDVSKTGLIIPSPAAVVSLYQRWKGKIEVLVDACQFRLSPETLRSYIEHNFMVALTGSKFFTGPTFSAALLVPKNLSERFRSQKIPKALNQYSCRAEWPDDWTARNSLPDNANYGLLLRWHAAMYEMQQFHSLPEGAVGEFVHNFAAAIKYKLNSETCFELLATAELERHPLSQNKNWDAAPTIFPFLLRHKNGEYLNREETENIYKLLRKNVNDQPIEIGQPVICGARDNILISAVRLCLSSRLIVAALSAKGRGGKAVIAETIAVLDKIKELLA